MIINFIKFFFFVSLEIEMLEIISNVIALSFFQIFLFSEIIRKQNSINCISVLKIISFKIYSLN